jgi:RNA polymerase sigma-70 factor (sigma-E family)
VVVVRDEAFEALFDGEHARCCAVARRLTGDAELARDLAAEAFARAWSHWPRLRRSDAPAAYVMRTLVNLTIDARRRRGRAPQGPAPLDEVGADDVAARLALVEALRRLPRRQREVVVLRHLADLSEADVAARLGVSAGTVKTQLHRGLAALRAQLGPLAPPEVGHAEP